MTGHSVRTSVVVAAVVAMLAFIVPVGHAAQGAADSRTPGSYIVTLRSGDPLATAREMARAHGGTVGYVYRHALRGFSLRISEQAAARIAADPRVVSVEPDAVVFEDEVVQQPSPPAPVGLDRIDQRFLPRDGYYTYDATGAGVTAYVIDSGIRTSHAEFGGRAVDGADFVDGALPADDCAGHGTHVAGTIGGSTYGVAKAVRLVAVRVLNCEGAGTASSLIAGIDWVTADHDPGEPAVANMSLGFSSGVTSVDTALRTSIADGIVYSVSAGNTNTSACDRSPSRVPEAITVGATDFVDRRATFSNYGACVDIFAPGTAVLSAGIEDDASFAWMSGTSMSAPHVAGVAALRLEGFPASTPKKVAYAITANATPNLIPDPGVGSPNQLLFSGFVTQPQENAAPTGSFTSLCVGLVCDFTATGLDPDGTVVSTAWNFGDGATGTGGSIRHTFSAAGTYSVYVVATDDEGASGTVTQDVTVATWDLTATAKKVKGGKTVTLRWNPAATTSQWLYVYRNGTAWYTTENTGTFVDNFTLGWSNSKTFTYWVCPTTDETRCSESATAKF